MTLHGCDLSGCDAYCVGKSSSPPRLMIRDVVRNSPCIAGRRVIWSVGDWICAGTGPDRAYILLLSFAISGYHDNYFLSSRVTYCRLASLAVVFLSRLPRVGPSLLMIRLLVLRKLPPRPDVSFRRNPTLTLSTTLPRKSIVHKTTSRPTQRRESCSGDLRVLDTPSRHEDDPL